jgi:hypothetical protein
VDALPRSARNTVLRELKEDHEEGEDGEREWIKRGIQLDGTLFRIARDQWEGHTAKRPEITHALDLTVQGMREAINSEPDRNQRDEPDRRFRVLTIEGIGQWQGYLLRVSVKYTRQTTGEWIKFYQSCWYEREAR